MSDTVTSVPSTPLTPAEPTITRNTIIEKAKQRLGPLYKSDDEKVFSEIGDTVITEAIIASNRSETPRHLEVLQSICIECIIIAYENRGNESLKSQSELGQSNSFVNWMEYLETNIIKKGKRLVM